jgi:glycosyltransferase involved in cell wall biosynthesis
MRILHVIQRYWPAVGGAEIHLGEISERLAAEGHQVTVATTDALDFELFWDSRRRRIAPPDDAHSGVRILRFPVRHLPAARLTYPSARRVLWLLSKTRVTPLPELFRLARFTPRVPELWHWLDITDEPFDLVAGVTICFEPLLEAGLRFAQRRGIPFVAYPFTHLGAGPRPGADVLSSFYTMRHQVAIVRESVAAAMQTRAEQAFYAAAGVPVERLPISGSGVTPSSALGGDGARFRQQHAIAAPLVVSLSAMSYDKGTVHLVEAVRRLWQAGRSLDLALAGSITEPFRRYLAALPAADRERLRVLGLVDEATKRDLLAAADVFAMPSRTDSFGIVYLEAWLNRKPVVAARAWGVSDLISDGEDGLLTPFGDASALAQGLADLLADPARRAAMGLCGERKVYQFHTWDRKYSLVRDLYLRLVKARESCAS